MEKGRRDVLPERHVLVMNERWSGGWGGFVALRKYGWADFGLVTDGAPGTRGRGCSDSSEIGLEVILLYCAFEYLHCWLCGFMEGSAALGVVGDPVFLIYFVFCWIPKVLFEPCLSHAFCMRYVYQETYV